MPIDQIPWWANAVGGALGGGVLIKMIEAFRDRGKTLSHERLSLREFEERLRSSVLHENEGLHSRLEHLEERMGELLEAERKCDERNRELEDRVETLARENAALKEDLEALSKLVTEEARKSTVESLRARGKS